MTTRSLALRYIRAEQLAVLESHGLIVVSRDEYEKARGAIRVHRVCACKRTFLAWTDEDERRCEVCRLQITFEEASA